MQTGKKIGSFCGTLLLFLLPSAPGIAQQAGKPVLTPEPAAVEPAPLPAPAKTTSGPASVSPNYVIGGDDVLQITVWREPNLSAASIPVRPDGKITLPLVGDVQAAGLTPMALAADITGRLKKYVTDPTVDVAVLGVNSKRVFMVGEVMHVGPIPITPGMTVLQAISSAGGLTPYANKKKIYILRGDPGKQQRVPFNYKKAIEGDMQGISLQPGDTIVAP